MVLITPFSGGKVDASETVGYPLRRNIYFLTYTGEGTHHYITSKDMAYNKQRYEQQKIPTIESYRA